MISITVHRGTHQIGGCITEIATQQTRVVIDMGTELPNAGMNCHTDTLEIPGVTDGRCNCDAVLITHYHEDHIGLLKQLLPGIPVFMGETAREIYLAYCRHIRHEILLAVDNAHPLRPGETLRIGDITITPWMVDHSAFDSYMFLIEAEGKRILHTGDFRTHGFRGAKIPKMLDYYVGQVDLLICEGTMLSRHSEKPIKESELGKQAKQLMREHQRTFVLCSSTNIDRIAAFYNARPDRRPMICDIYQKRLLDIVRERNSHLSTFYDFKYVYPYTEDNGKLKKLMNERGFVALIRANSWSRSLIDQYGSGSKIIYSMWKGYLNGTSRNPPLVEFLEPYDFITLHTSGHASVDDLIAICRTVQPRMGIIPIHSESPELFNGLLPEMNVLSLQDGEKLML